MRCSSSAGTPGPRSATVIAAVPSRCSTRTSTSPRPAAGAQGVLEQVAQRAPQQPRVEARRQRRRSAAKRTLDAGRRRRAVVSDHLAHRRRRGRRAARRGAGCGCRSRTPARSAAARRPGAGCCAVQRSKTSSKRSGSRCCTSTMCSVESRMGVSGFLISWAMMRAISAHACRRCERSTSVTSSTTSSALGSPAPGTGTQASRTSRSVAVAAARQVHGRLSRLRLSAIAADAGEERRHRRQLRRAPPASRAAARRRATPSSSPARRLASSTRPRSSSETTAELTFSTMRSTTCFSRTRRCRPSAMRRAISSIASTRAASSCSLGGEARGWWRRRRCGACPRRAAGCGRVKVRARRVADGGGDQEERGGEQHGATPQLGKLALQLLLLGKQRQREEEPRLALAGARDAQRRVELEVAGAAGPAGAPREVVAEQHQLGVDVAGDALGQQRRPRTARACSRR